MTDAPQRLSPERLETWNRMVAEIDALRATVADRDAELLRIRTAENAAAVAIERLRVAMTGLPSGTHPSEIAGQIERIHADASNAHAMDTAMAAECRDALAGAGYSHPFVLDGIRAVIAELNAASVECEARAAEIDALGYALLERWTLTMVGHATWQIRGWHPEKPDTAAQDSSPGSTALLAMGMRRVIRNLRRNGKAR